MYVCVHVCKRKEEKYCSLRAASNLKWDHSGGEFLESTCRGSRTPKTSSPPRPLSARSRPEFTLRRHDRVELSERRLVLNFVMGIAWNACSWRWCARCKMYVYVKYTERSHITVLLLLFPTPYLFLYLWAVCTEAVRGVYRCAWTLFTKEFHS